MKKIILMLLLACTCFGCSTNVQLIQEMNYFETKNNFNKNIELCVNTDSIPEPYIRNPTSYTARGHDFIFELKKSLASKTEYGFSRIFTQVDKCNASTGDNYRIEVIYSNVDLSFACSYASGKFDEAVFNSDIYLTITNKNKSEKKISKKKSISRIIRYEKVGGDMFLTNQAMDKALSDYFDFLTNDQEILGYFSYGIGKEKSTTERLKELDQLYSDRIISDEEYKETRNKILKEI